jgi:hypothetical protein
MEHRVLCALDLPDWSGYDGSLDLTLDVPYGMEQRQHRCQEAHIQVYSQDKMISNLRSSWHDAPRARDLCAEDCKYDIQQSEKGHSDVQRDQHGVESDGSKPRVLADVFGFGCELRLICSRVGREIDQPGAKVACAAFMELRTFVQLQTHKDADEAENGKPEGQGKRPQAGREGDQRYEDH